MAIFINEVKGNWILNIIGNDIYNYLSKIGYPCRKGNYEDYDNEEICLHMWWRHAKPYKNAKLNSVFVTHIDDIVKEYDLVSMKDEFDIFFCMSLEDASFLIELGFDKEKVFGLNLPVRNTYIRPLSLGIFSNCYSSFGVKNEQWLIDYCAQHSYSQLVIFVFIGHGWENVIRKLLELGCSVEWCCINRNLPGEYMYQQLKLSNIDYYLYMGMDGGAMGTYDAYAMGCPLCVSDDGYHKGIPDIDYSFSKKEEFYKQLTSIIEKQVRKINFFKENSVENYVNSILYIFENHAYPDTRATKIAPAVDSVKEKRRNNYFSLTFERVRQPFVSLIIKFLNERKLNNKCK